MARSKFIEVGEFGEVLQKLGNSSEDIQKKALRAGAKIIADEMKKRLQGVLSADATGQLVGAFGITPIKADAYGNFNVHIGFDGYQTPGYGKFRAKGVPFRLIAASFESGAVMGGRYRDENGNATRNKRKMRKFGREDYWRQPTPFIRPSIQATKGKAEAEMVRVMDEEIKKIT